MEINGETTLETGRLSGVLLHPSSLPGPFGIGNLGSGAYGFIDFLESAGAGLWQVLPLGPTGYGDSPYASLSSFAGNPLLIDPAALVETGDLDAEDLHALPEVSGPEDRVDFEKVYSSVLPLLRKGADNFIRKASSARRKKYEEFTLENRAWLDDFALYSAVKDFFDAKAAREGAPTSIWNVYWDKDIALREEKSVKNWAEKCGDAVETEKVLQFFFFQQWALLKEYGNRKQIRIIGDIPIFVAADSADLWANREQFLLDEGGRLKFQAGVPPDYFSKTGQLWGNPLYDWETMGRRNFDWWFSRIAIMLKMVDYIRIDHFRGFESYWKVSADEKTAEKGAWEKAPGDEFFRAVRKAFGALPFLAEDLGVITPEVEKLRDDFSFPGMKILQFAFETNEAGDFNAQNPFLPHNYGKDAVVYTGTHDNDTTLGWYLSRRDEEKDLIRRYLARPDHDIVWDFIRTALSSPARMAVIPMQDLLCLDSGSRMNVPSVPGGNWSWRMRKSGMNPFVAGRLREMNELYGRLPR